MKALIKLLGITIFPFMIGLSLPESTLVSDENQVDFSDHLDGPYTGGFNEQTCHSCHFDYDLNMPEGSLTLKGFDEYWKPGKTYQVEIILQAEQLEVGGFQMTTRFEDGSQAGGFGWDHELLKFTPSSSVGEDVQYLQHSSAGIIPSGERKIRWFFLWTAPTDSISPVIINIAANSGNDDDSAFGDWIYVQEKILKPRNEPQ